MLVHARASLFLPLPLPLVCLSFCLTAHSLGHSLVCFFSWTRPSLGRRRRRKLSLCYKYTTGRELIAYLYKYVPYVRHTRNLCYLQYMGEMIHTKIKYQLRGRKKIRTSWSMMETSDLQFLRLSNSPSSFAIGGL